jgi:hypothetical protein
MDTMLLLKYRVHGHEHQIVMKGKNHDALSIRGAMTRLLSWASNYYGDNDNPRGLFVPATIYSIEYVDTIRVEQVPEDLPF